MATSFVPAPLIVEIQVLQRLFGQEVENTFYYDVEGEPTEAELTDLANKAIVQWINHMLNWQSGDLTLVGAIATDLTTATSPSVQVSTTATPGLNDTPSMPGNVCLSVKRTTAARGRGARGRVYIAGIPPNAVVADGVDTSYGDAVVGALNTIMANMAEADTAPAGADSVLHRISGGVPLSEAVVRHTLSYGLADYNLDSQRRRLAGRGK